jgi:hypothetical protein
MLALLNVECRRNEREKSRPIVRVAAPHPKSGGLHGPVHMSHTRGRAPLAGWLAQTASTAVCLLLLGDLVTTDHVPGARAGRFLEPWILGYFFIACSRAVPLGGSTACRHPTAHISVRSNLSRRATPENPPRCGLTRTPATRARNRRGPPRRSRRCQTDVLSDASPDRSRSSIPTDLCRGDSRCARQSCRREHRRNKCASIADGVRIGGG